MPMEIKTFPNEIRRLLHAHSVRLEMAFPGMGGIRPDEAFASGAL